MRNRFVFFLTHIIGGSLILAVILLSPAVGLWAVKPKIALEHQPESASENLQNIPGPRSKSNRASDLQWVEPKSRLKRVPSFQEGPVGIVELNRIPTKSQLMTKEFNQQMARLQKKSTAWAIYIQEGHYSIPSLTEMLENSQVLRREGVDYYLSLPLIIGPEARLTIDGDTFKELRIEAETGGFIYNYGQLHILNAHISSWNQKQSTSVQLNKESSLFRPFIVGWSGSETYIQGSTLENLGFPREGATGLSFIATKEKYLKRSLFRLLPFAKKRNRSSMNQPPKLEIQNSHIKGLSKGLYLAGVKNATVYKTEFKDILDIGLHLSKNSENIYIVKNTVQGSSSNIGIKIDQKTHKVLIQENQLSDGKKGLQLLSGASVIKISSNKIRNCTKDGIQIDDSAELVVDRNEIYENGGTGLEINQISKNATESNFISENTIFKNSEHGIKVQNASDLVIWKNQIYGNKKNGTFFVESEKISILANRISLNESNGVSGHQVQQFQIKNNIIEKNKKNGVFFKDVQKIMSTQNSILNNSKYGLALTENMNNKQKLQFFLYGPRKKDLKNVEFNIGLDGDELISNHQANIRVDQFDKLRLQNLRGDIIDRNYFYGHLKAHWSEISHFAQTKDQFISLSPLENW